MSVVSELANKVSKTAADSNKYWKYLFEMVDQLDKKENKDHPQLYHLMEYEIIPKLNKQGLVDALNFFTESELSHMDKSYFSEVINRSLAIDRVAVNHRALSKRFNIEKIAAESVIHNTIDEGVWELCNLIDTYDIKVPAKFNIALENITYAMQIAGHKESILEQIVDYFLTTSPVITDENFDTMQYLVKSNQFISDEDKKKVSYFTEAKGREYEKHISLLACKCKDDNVKAFIMDSTKIRNEKEAAKYINKAVIMAGEDVEDSMSIIKSVFALPLLGKVSKSFVVYQYKLASDKNKINKKYDKDFDKQIKDIIDDDDDENLITEASMIIEEDFLQNTVVEVATSTNFPCTAIMESEDYADTEDIPSILNDFKAEQKKSLGRFKYYLGKIYRKSPQNIIDSTPNIFSIVRVVFILAPAAVPIVGPIISLILVFIDRLISMDINNKQCESLIKKLDAERDKVNKDIEKKPERKEELEKYGKCIDKCTKKVEAYRDANISSEEIEGRKRPGSSKSSDFDFDMDDDFSLEQTLAVISAMNTIMEAKQNNLTEKVCSIITEVLTETTSMEEINSLMEAASCCKRTVNMEPVVKALRSSKKGKPIVESVQLESVATAYALYSYETEDTIDDIMTEAYYVEQITQVINEGFNLSKLKLLFNVAKDKARDLNTKQRGLWRNMDIAASGFMKSVERAMTSDRREGIIKGSLVPSFSKCMKTAIGLGVISFINPVLGIITAMGMIGVSKSLNYKERQLIYDEIDTELKVVEKEIEMANNDGDMKRYRCMLQYQKRLEREKQRIKYGMKVHGRDVPMYDSRPKGDDY